METDLPWFLIAPSRTASAFSMWHTDYILDDGRWFICHEGDASRFVAGYGTFEHAAMELEYAHS